MFGHTFGSTSATFNGGKKVWHEVKAQYPVGGVIDIADKNVGDIIPAGTLFALDMANHKAGVAYSATKAYKVGDVVINEGKIYKCKTNCSAAAWSTNSSKFELTNGGFGLLQNDLVIDELAKSETGAATVSLVYDGVIYASRTNLTAADLALVPQITPVFEN